MERILVTTASEYPAEARKVLETIGTVDVRTVTQRDLVRTINTYTILIVGLGLRVDEDVIIAGKRLKLIATATTGTDHIDLIAAKARKIPVVSLKGERAFLDGISATAELAWGLLIGLVRNIPVALKTVHQGQWHQQAHIGHMLRGKTLGIVGLGRLGTMVAGYGAAFGMTVLATDPTVKKAPKGVKLVPLKTLLAESDCVSIHAPLIDETKGLIDAKAIAAMKDGAVLVNTARGGIVDEAAILKALKSGHLAGYATDVLDGETMFNGDAGGHPLVAYARTHENVLITPHIGGTTEESRAMTDVFIAKKVVAAL